MPKLLDNITDYEPLIYETIEQYKLEYPESDISKSQMNFTHMLRYIYKKLFKPDKPMINNQNCIVPYEDTEKLIYLCNIYIDICTIYNRDCTLYGFLCNMLGIEDHTVYNMWLDNTELGSRRKVITEKIQQAHELALRSKLYDSNNITGQLALANYDLGFNMPGVREQRQNVQLIGSDNLPKLEISVKNS